ncbi:MAG: C2 family cysteine protease [Phycisphaerae bacterium]
MHEVKPRVKGGFWDRLLGLRAGSSDPDAAAQPLEPRVMLAGGPRVGVTQLLAPAGFAAVTVNADNVRLAWSAPGVGATGYRIMRAGATGDFTAIASVSSATQLSFTDTAVQSNTAYRYQIMSLNGTNASAPSAAASVWTPLFTPTEFRTSIVSLSSVAMTWQARDPSATSYIIVRSTSGGAFMPLRVVSGGSTTSYVDTTVAWGTVYAYRIQATSGTKASAISASATAAVPALPPANLQAQAGPTAINVSWTAGGARISSYVVQRSLEGGPYTTVATLAGTAAAYADNGVIGGARYNYRVTASVPGVPSSVADASTVLSTIRPTTRITATASTSGAVVAWADTNGAFVGYAVQRSSNGTTFDEVAQVAAGAAKTWTDADLPSGGSVWYRVVARRTGLASVTSSPVIFTPGSSGGGGADSGVAVSIRYGNELVVTTSGGTSAIRASAVGSTLSITAGTAVIAQVAMPSSLFIYDRAGTRAITIDQSVTTRIIISSVGGAASTITSSAANVSAWIDTTDVFTGTGTVNRIATLAGNVSKAVGASLPNPTDSGGTMAVNASLFGSGPTAGDINQGAIGDCYYIASLAAFATSRPNVVRESAVDLGDGTYIVKFIRSGSPVFVRVSNQVPTAGGSSYRYARPGAAGTVWVPIMEKAFAYFRSGANTYASISGGWMGEVYSAMGVNSSTIWMNTTVTEESLFTMLSSDMAAGRAVTFGTISSAPNLVGGHAYSLISAVRDANGVARYTVRNPWGVSGKAIENSSGVATLTFEQMKANFNAGVRAVA